MGAPTNQCEDLGNSYFPKSIYLPKIPYITGGATNYPVDYGQLRSIITSLKAGVITGIRCRCVVQYTTGGGGGNGALAPLFSQFLAALRINDAYGEWLNISQGSILRLGRQQEYQAGDSDGLNAGAGAATTRTFYLRVPFPQFMAPTGGGAVVAPEYRRDMENVVAGDMSFDMPTNIVGPNAANQFTIVAAGSSYQWIVDYIDEKVWSDKAPWVFKDFSLAGKTALTIDQVCGRLRWAHYYAGVTAENAGTQMSLAQKFQSVALGYPQPRFGDELRDLYLQNTRIQYPDPTVGGTYPAYDDVYAQVSIPLWSPTFFGNLGEDPEVNGLDYNTDGAVPANDARMACFWVPNRKKGVCTPSDAGKVGDLAKMSNGLLRPLADVPASLREKITVVDSRDYADPTHGKK